ncbi:MAG: hypothetical protein ACRCY4_01645 [Brevinema sp.]
MPKNDIDTTLKNYFRSQEPPFPSVAQEKKMLAMIRGSRRENHWWKIAAILAIGIGLYIGAYTTGEMIAAQKQAFIGGEKEIILQQSRDRWLKPIDSY